MGAAVQTKLVSLASDGPEPGNTLRTLNRVLASTLSHRCSLQKSLDIIKQHAFEIVMLFVSQEPGTHLASFFVVSRDMNQGCGVDKF